MGQAFGRASGRIRKADPSPPTKRVSGDRRPAVGPTEKVEVTRRTTATEYIDQAISPLVQDEDCYFSFECAQLQELTLEEFLSHEYFADAAPRVNADNVLEERDPQYDAMLTQMVGRITAKPGGKLETGEASVVERYNRPMPKLRNTKSDSGGYEDRPAPPGTLNVAQLRHMMLLHQGKADDHNGPMDINQIAEKFKLEVSQVQRFSEFMSIPPENGNKKKGYQ